MPVIAQMEFELAYFKATVPYVSHNAMELFLMLKEVSNFLSPPLSIYFKEHRKN